MPTPTGISGSRAAAILNMVKPQYGTPFTVWQDIQEQRHGEGWNKAQGYEYEPFQGNTATEFGHAFETPIIKLTEQVTGHEITERESKYSLNATGSSRLPVITCHIDGIINHGLFEGKTANFRVFSSDWGEPGTDRIPTAYQCQLQHNLMCAGLTEATMSVLVFPATVQEWERSGWQAHYDQLNGVFFLKNHETDQIVDPLTWANVFADIGNFHQYHIEAKPDTHKILMELYSEFWGRYVVGDEVPEAVDYSDIRRIFTAPKGTLVISGSDTIGGEKVIDMMREYPDINGQIGSGSRLAKRKAFIKTQILKFAADKTTVADDDCQEKIVFRDEQGGKLGQFDGKTFRG